MKQKYNHLGGAQQHKLNMYIEKNRELAIEASDYSIAVKASQELGYPVTESNIRGAREAVGVKKRFAREDSAIKPRYHSELAKALIELYEDLGKEPPCIIRDIAANKKMGSAHKETVRAINNF
jgi:hypothetical protein